MRSKNQLRTVLSLHCVGTPQQYLPPAPLQRAPPPPLWVPPPQPPRDPPLTRKRRTSLPHRTLSSETTPGRQRSLVPPPAPDARGSPSRTWTVPQAVPARCCRGRAVSLHIPTVLLKANAENYVFLLFAI
ncbi:WAS/WASL-interacting protein family member 3-like isoform X1 [Poecilia reticulata]|uniref:WAS/WASL-interacting protein family member 3-like isoform X1 n=1 Tax=Poecilia reticulata TaxID=8081 RepID=UPI0007EB8EF5|nr:PREDICTED: WAS/WASL-interacting protein family member 3-like isoform X1 [Poecilia reticulata]